METGESVQSRVEYQRARRAELAQSAPVLAPLPHQEPVALAQEPVAPAQEQVVLSAPELPETSLAQTTNILPVLTAGDSPANAVKRSAYSAFAIPALPKLTRAEITRRARLACQNPKTASLAAVAVSVTLATLLPAVVQPAAHLLATESAPQIVADQPISAFGLEIADLALGDSADNHILAAPAAEPKELTHIEAVLEAHAELLDIDRPIAASRSAERLDLAEIFYEEIESEQLDLFIYAANALTTAELYLSNETRTTPEIAEEIRISSELLREAMQTAPYVYVEEDLDELYEFIDWATQRLDNALLEAEPPVAVAEPRILTTAENFAILVEQAVADAPRLAQTYASIHDGLANGRLPDSVLRPLSWSPNHRLRPDAAAQLERLNEAFRLEFGTDLVVSDSYRTFAGQQRLWPTGRGARPGTSLHGWGLAVDLSGGINRFGTPQTRWMRANAHYFGWHWPPGSPWHWEFIGH